MSNINNYETYNNTMRVSMTDKTWWVNKIPAYVKAVIDYGCAQGDLFSYLEEKYPERFSCYIGIDNNENMLKLGREKNMSHTFFFPNLRCISFNPNTVLVLNSVIHEILHYDSIYTLRHLLQKAYKDGVAAIAIRDMHPSKEIDNDIFQIYQNFINGDNVPSSWYSYVQRNNINRFNGIPEYFQEYLLKYNYKENWSREVTEKYLWDWETIIKDTLDPNYTIVINNSFTIPQQQERIKRDLNIQLNSNTHKKMLIVRKDV